MEINIKQKTGNTNKEKREKRGNEEDGEEDVEQDRKKIN